MLRLSALLLASALATMALPANAATFTVTSTANAGTGTLRSAITSANAAAGADTIVFNIPGAGIHNMGPTSSLPPLGSDLTVDATTQPGYAGSPLVELDGAAAGAGVHGLLVNGSAVTIRGLAIVRYQGDGVRIQAGASNRIAASWIGVLANGLNAAGNNNGVWVDNTGQNTIGPGNVISGNRVDGVRIHGASATGNIVAGNRIGTNVAGSAALGNAFNGVTITSATGNTIGGSTPADLNVISGNTRYGVGFGAGANSNLVARNYIGVDANGDVAIANIRSGVLILDSRDNRIGGDVPGTFNVISGNSENGVEIRGALATGNLVQRNVIGTDLAGNVARGNFLSGVMISGAAGNIVGASTPQANGSNLISGNAYAGIRLLEGADNTVVQGNRIGTNLAGNASLANDFGIVADEADGLRLGVAGNGNLVSGNFAIGILTQGSSNVRIESNLIGTRLDGAAALANGGGGIFMTIAAGGCSNITIGGLWGASGNLISGNRLGASPASGVSLDCNDVVIKGNRVGTNLAGNGIVANEGDGVRASGSNLIIGGTDHTAWTCDRECNLISGNGYGVSLTGSGAVRGNFIGVRADGNAALSNRTGGVTADGGFTIGGTAAGAGNLIAGNFGNGVAMYGGVSVSVMVQGNRIGTNAAGTAGIANGGSGVQITYVRSVIGGSDHDPGVCNRACNLIGVNREDGIAIDDFDTGFAHEVRGNFIGTTLSGSCLGNDGMGVRLSGASGNATGASVGGPGATDGNLIACNTGSGVIVYGDAARYSLRRNRIHSNGLLGINLFGVAGVDANDPGDTDVGANGLQNFPVLSGAVLAGGTLSITGSLNSAAARAYTIDFYRSPACDASGHGEGAEWLGSQQVNTSAGGIANVALDVAGSFVVGDAITTTATANAESSTSEFSGCIAVTPAPLPGSFAFSAAAFSVAESTSEATLTVTRSGGTAGSVSINFATANGSATAPADYQSTTGTLAFGPGETVRTIDVNLVSDLADEADETFTVTLSSPTGGATLGTPSTATVTITDDDAAPTVAITDRSCVEGNAGTTSCAFTIGLSGMSGRTVSGSASTANGTATAGSDYTALVNAPWSVAAGATTTTVSVSVIGDVTDEPDETFVVNLAGLVNAATAANDLQGIGSVVDDDAMPSVGINERDCVEGNTGTTACTFTITLSRASGRAVSGRVSTNNFTAQAGSDYTALVNAPWSIAVGAITASVNVAVLGDTLDEPNEEFELILSALVNADPDTSDLQGVGRILDDDAGPPGTLRFAGPATASVPETIGVTGYVVERVGGTEGAVGVSYTTVNVTAIAGSDYQARSGTLTWAAGDSTVQGIAVPIINDTVPEPTERFVLIIDAPTGGATLGTPNEVEIEIRDNDGGDIFRNGFE